MGKSNKAGIESIEPSLFRISRSLHRFRKLEERLSMIAEEVRRLLSTEGACVILIDGNEFFFRFAQFDDSETGKKMMEIRFPIDKGVAGHVYITGEPIIVDDVYNDRLCLTEVDSQVAKVDKIIGFKTKSMLDVPIKIEKRTIGVLCAINKKQQRFNQKDIDMLSAIAEIVAIPIENARMNDEIHSSYKELERLNHIKDEVINLLSHELKTPVSVIGACFKLLEKKECYIADKKAKGDIDNIISRGRRNIERLLKMQYKIEKINRDSGLESLIL